MADVVKRDFGEYLDYMFQELHTWLLQNIAVQGIVKQNLKGQWEGPEALGKAMLIRFCSIGRTWAEEICGVPYGAVKRIMMTCIVTPDKKTHEEPISHAEMVQLVNECYDQMATNARIRKDLKESDPKLS